MPMPIEYETHRYTIAIPNVQYGHDASTQYGPSRETSYEYQMCPSNFLLGTIR
jgi:hypothetical protein